MKSRTGAWIKAGLLLGAVALIPLTTAGLARVDGRVAQPFGRLLTVYRLVKADYVEKTKDDKLVTGAIDGMLASLDPHSTYLEGASLERLDTMIDGSYAGLGLSVEESDGGVKVVAPMRGSPAAKAGVKAGDYITHLNGKLIYGDDLDAAVEKMRGPAGSTVHLTLYRPGHNEPINVTITRGVITLQPVTSELAGTIGVITVNEFSHNVGKEAFDAIKSLRRQVSTTPDGHLTGLILDLRQNPGGELDEAVALSDLFLSHGVIVSQRGRLPNENKTWRAESVFSGDAAAGLPIIVLIDSGTASASEIVAGALQDDHRALIMGERSFGKGSVQSLINIDRTHALKLTTARYYTPSGRSVQEGGIVPDIRVSQITDPDARAHDENALREADLKAHLVNEVALNDKPLEGSKVLDPSLRMTPAQLSSKNIKDFQLWYAEQTLRHATTSSIAMQQLDMARTAHGG